MTPPMQENRVGAMTLPQVMDPEGRAANLVSIDEAGGQAFLRPEHGPDIGVPLDWLQQNADGGYGLRIALARVAGMNGETPPDSTVIPLHEETLKIDRRRRDTGKGVRVLKTVTHTEQTVDEALETETFSVQRIPRSDLVSEAPPSRQEGDTLIIPVLEEVLVVEKRLRLKEEIHITRQRSTTHKPQIITLRSEHIDIDRFDDSAAPDEVGS
jgi:uncharacterized protein (TIGR02271 family)